MFYNVFVPNQMLWQLSASRCSNTTKKETVLSTSRSELPRSADRLLHQDVRRRVSVHNRLHDLRVIHGGHAHVPEPGLLGVGGHLLLARAYAQVQAIRLAPLDYTALIWAVLIGYFAFDEVPQPAAGLGAVLIVSGAWLASRRGKPA